jgi:hypothetical protein
MIPQPWLEEAWINKGENNTTANKKQAPGLIKLRGNNQFLFRSTRRNSVFENLSTLDGQISWGGI